MDRTYKKNTILEYNEVSSDKPETYYKRGCKLLDEKFYAEAIEDFNNALKFGYDNPNFKNLLAETYYKSGCKYLDAQFVQEQSFKEAIEDFNNALKLGFDCPGFKDLIANTYFESGRNLSSGQEAIKDFDNALKFGYDDLASLYYLRGMEKDSLGQYEEAIKDFALSIQHGYDSRAYLDKADAESSLGLYKEAIEDYNKYFEDEGEEGCQNIEIFYYNRGYAKYKLGLDWEEDYKKSENFGKPYETL